MKAHLVGLKVFEFHPELKLLESRVFVKVARRSPSRDANPPQKLGSYIDSRVKPLLENAGDVIMVNMEHTRRHPLRPPCLNNQ